MTLSRPEGPEIATPENVRKLLPYVKTLHFSAFCVRKVLLLPIDMFVQSDRVDVQCTELLISMKLLGDNCKVAKLSELT